MIGVPAGGSGDVHSLHVPSLAGQPGGDPLVCLVARVRMVEVGCDLTSLLVTLSRPTPTTTGRGVRWGRAGCPVRSIATTPRRRSQNTSAANDIAQYLGPERVPRIPIQLITLRGSRERG